MSRIMAVMAIRSAALVVAVLALILAGLPYLGLGGAVRTSLVRNPDILQQASDALNQRQADQQKHAENERPGDMLSP